MKLADYLYETKITPSHFRRMLGGIVTCRSPIRYFQMVDRQVTIPPSIRRKCEGLI
ncbi:MAG: hypothetical protein AAFY46_13115 [Planctomycetota bacterium]